MGKPLVAAHHSSRREMQQIAVEPGLLAKSASGPNVVHYWGMEDVALAVAVATALSSVAIVIVAVIVRCNKLAQQRETEKSRFCDTVTDASTPDNNALQGLPDKQSARDSVSSRRASSVFNKAANRALKPKARLPTTTQSGGDLSNSERMSTSKPQPRTPPMPPRREARMHKQAQKTRDDESKRSAAVKPELPLPLMQTRHEAVAARTAPTTTRNVMQPRVAKGPVTGAGFLARQRK